MSTASTLQPGHGPLRPARDEPLYEVVNGQYVELPPMGIYATWVASQLHGPMHVFAARGRLGTVVSEALFILDSQRDLRRRPDVAFVSAATWPLDRPLPEVGDWKVVPDLAVEVVSPNDLFDAVLAKMHDYFDKGVRQVWIVAPSKRQIYLFDSTTRVRILTVNHDLDGGTLLPGFRLPVADLFKPQAETSTPTHV